MASTEPRQARPGADWSKRLGMSVGAAIERRRREVDMLGKALQERTRELGLEISVSTLSKIERGEKAFLSLAEVLVIAAALDCSPSLLLAPIRGTTGFDPGSEVELLPGTFVPIEVATEWLHGWRPEFLPMPPGTAFVEVMRADSWAQKYLTEHTSVVAQMYVDELMLRHERNKPNDGRDEGEIDRLTRQLEDKLIQLRDLRARMMHARIVTPTLKPWLRRHFDSETPLPWGLDREDGADA